MPAHSTRVPRPPRRRADPAAERDVSPIRSGLGQAQVLTIGLVVAIVGGHWLVPYLDHPSLQTWSVICVAIIVQSTPFLLLGVLLSAMIASVVSERFLNRVVPRNPVLAVPAAGLAGIGLPGCECAAVPVAGGLVRRGVTPAVALTFLLAAPAVNPAVLVSTAVAFPNDHRMVVARFAASLTTAVAVGWWCLYRGDRLRIGRLASLEHLEGSAGARFVATVRHDFLHAAGFLVFGAMVAATVNTFTPRSVLNTVAGHVVLGVLGMALFAFVVALCSESDAFVAASFTAFSDTAKLVFLTVGPAMDVKLASMEAGQFGAAFARQFVPVVLGTAIAAALVVGALVL